MIISQTPLRISFVGGGTDIESYYSIESGQVLSATIDKYVFVIVKERFDSDIYVSWSQKQEVVNDVRKIEHELVRESLIKVGIKKSVEITMLADIPSSGSGLGSSSSITVGLLNALYAFKGISVTAETLAEQACEIEIDILGKPIGKQDQYATAYGGLNKIIFNADHSVDVSPVELLSTERLLLGSNLILQFTGITRDANSILFDQKLETEKNKIELAKISSFVPILYKALNEKRFDELGILLKKNWEYKKQLSDEITNDKIEEMVATADINGALGCKISGAGGGGFLLSYVPREYQNNFRKAMEEYTELPFMLDPFGSRIIFNMSRYNAGFNI